MGKNGQLQTRQRRALAALLCASSVRAAAADADVPETSLRRWLREDADFQAELRVLESELAAQATRLLKSQLARAVKALGDTLDGDSPGAVVGAAKVILDTYVRTVGLEELERRVEAIEQQRGGEVWQRSGN